MHLFFVSCNPLKYPLVNAKKVLNYLTAWTMNIGVALLSSCPFSSQMAALISFLAQTSENPCPRSTFSSHTGRFLSVSGNPIGDAFLCKSSQIIRFICETDEWTHFVFSKPNPPWGLKISNRFIIVKSAVNNCSFEQKGGPWANCLKE